MMKDEKIIVLSEIKYDANGLIPAIVQDANSDEVLMMAYMNAESLALTVSTGETHFWSRSRRVLCIRERLPAIFKVWWMSAWIVMQTLC